MIFRRSLSVAALFGASLSAVSGWAQVPAAVPAISPQLVDRLCPVTGAQGLKLGAPRAEQPQELLRSLRKLPAEFAPFTSAELVTTAWSGRVAAITYRAPLPDEQDGDELLYAFDDAMRAAGWGGTVLDKTITPLSYLGGRSLEREVEGAAGKQMQLLEFDTSGALGLRCGDPALLELDRRELDGTLEPGSLRPQPAIYDPSLRLPDSSACQSPAVQRLTASRENFDEDAPELIPFLAAAMQESDRAHHGKRLNTWLEWKLLNSGKVDDDRLVELRTKAAKRDVEDEMKLVMGMLAIGGEIAEARETGNAAASCEGLRKLMVFEHDKSLAQHEFWTRVNAALEAEAKRLGIVLD